MKSTLEFEIQGHDKKYIVHELTVRQIVGFAEFKSIENLTMQKIRDIFIDDALPIATNIKKEELLDMAPSEVEIIWDKFREVNKVFFQVLKKANLGEIVEGVRAIFLKTFFDSLVDSSKQVTPKH